MYRKIYYLIFNALAIHMKSDHVYVCHIYKLILSRFNVITTDNCHSERLKV
jgi:hypothetical protein